MNGICADCSELPERNDEAHDVNIHSLPEIKPFDIMREYNRFLLGKTELLAAFSSPLQSTKVDNSLRKREKNRRDADETEQEE